MPVAKLVTQHVALTDRLAGCLQGEYELCAMPELQSRASDCALLILGVDLLQGSTDQDIARIIDEHEKAGIPVLLTWADEQDDHRELAIKLGCSDYLAPPLITSVVNAKCKTHVSLATLKRQHAISQLDVASSLKAGSTACADEHEMIAVQDAAILCLATIARVRDHSTGNHILRTQHYVKSLAEHLRKNPKFSQELDPTTIELFYKTAALHDIGKVGIPDHILQKPGKLTEQEYEIMKNHTLLGYQAVHSAELLLERESGVKAAKFLQIAQQVTLSHHERWDGTGYPQGLKGDEIPLVARLMAVADVYDAMISRRPYKGPLDHQEVADVIQSGKGSHFDPDVVEAFMDLQDMFERISTKLEDVFPSTADLTLHSMAELIKEQG